jgi:hypothetical protein
VTRKQTWVPEHYQPAQSSWRRDTCERIHARMIAFVRDKAATTDPLASAIAAHVASCSPWHWWQPTEAVINDLVDALAARDDVTDAQLDAVRHWCWEANREIHGLPHLGKLQVCERCGAPAFDEDGEQPDACWAGECTTPELEARANG